MLLHNVRALMLSAAIACWAPTAASAQASSVINPGMQVVDPSGAAVGMVVSVKGNELTIKTDKHEVLLPATSFTRSEGKLLFALSRAQLNAQTEQAINEANAKLVAGTSVYDQGGTLAGTIDAIDDTTVTMKLTSGQLVRMPRKAIAPGTRGAVLGISAAELQQIAKEAR